MAECSQLILSVALFSFKKYNNMKMHTWANAQIAELTEFQSEKSVLLI